MAEALGLDFSKLDSLAYRGFEGAEARAEKDKLIEQGFTIVEGLETPFSASAAPEQPKAKPNAETPIQRKLAPFTGHDESRNYRAMYRAACNYHERHNPPTVNREYWKTHTPGLDDTPEEELSYWEDVAKDMGATASAGGNDPFLIGLLVEIMEELEREYKAIREAAASSAA